MKARAKEDKPTYISKGNVIDDLGFSPEEAAAIKLKASLHAEILRVVASESSDPEIWKRFSINPSPASASC